MKIVSCKKWKKKNILFNLILPGQQEKGYIFIYEGTTSEVFHNNITA